MKAFVNAFFDSKISPTLFSLWLSQQPTGDWASKTMATMRRNCKKRYSILFLLVAVLTTGLVGRVLERTPQDYYLIGASLFLTLLFFFLTLVNIKDFQTSNLFESFLADCQKLNGLFPSSGYRSENELRETVENSLVDLARNIIKLQEPRLSWEHYYLDLDEAARNEKILENRKVLREHHALFLSFGLTPESWDEVFTKAREQLEKETAQNAVEA